jgi:hypothetical protein
MGAANALAAYQLYGATVGDRPLRLLVYMALVSKDKDAEPWCGIGHEQLSRHALGVTVPDLGRATERRRVLRRVERAVTDLADAGAIRTVRRASYGVRGITPAKYRLYLTQPCADSRPPRTTRQKMTGGEKAGTTRQKMTGGEKATRHSVATHPSKNGRPPVTQRRTKEEEEKEERKIGVLPSTRKVEGSLNGAAPADNTEVDAERRAFGRLAPERQARLLQLAVSQLGTDAPNAEVIHAAVQLAEAGTP